MAPASGESSVGGLSAPSYRDSGVDVDAAADVKSRIADLVARTHGPQVLGGVGGFGALYSLSGFREPVLVSSTDGVGTKSKIAAALGRYDGLGEDVVNACVNDVIVCGATPAYFLDYIGVGELDAAVVEDLLSGMVRACETAGCALIGGETAQMPGVYAEGDFDLVGFAVGVVERDEILDPADVEIGDVLVGLPSSGLHTNGYSLVRRVFDLDDDPSPLYRHRPELGRTLGEELLEPHLSYVSTVRRVRADVKSIAHVTGGGLIENLPRALPDGTAASLDRRAWDVPPIFSVIQSAGEISDDEMFRVFNMGLGMVLVCDSAKASALAAELPGAKIVGEVTAASGQPRVRL